MTALAVASPAVQADRLFRFYHADGDEIFALCDVSISIDPGEIVAVVGPSGSGKSTLMSLVAGLDDPSGGTVHLNGEPMSHRPDAERASLRRRHVGILYQSDNLFAHLTVAENVELVAYLTGRPGRPARSLLDQVGLGRRAGSLPSELSGGELARAGLAVALAAAPTLLIADEPTGELDSTSETSLLELLHREASSGTAIIIATHSSRVTAFADRVIHLEDGRLTAARVLL